MKPSRSILIALGLAAIYGLAACGGDKEHAHGGAEHDHEDHAGGADGDGGGDHDHDHDKIVAGPNGGRVLTGIEPHAEFFVMDDRKVQIGFVDDDIKPIPAAAQTVSIVAGDRANPTKLSFVKSGDVLISEQALPDGSDFPIVVQIKSTADAKSIREKFNLNMEQCPTCENKEYACTCEHGEGE